LVIGTGAANALPVMEAVKAEAQRRDVQLVMVPTKRAIDLPASDSDATNAILHVTCMSPADDLIKGLPRYVLGLRSAYAGRH
jgi:hypothetical protein